MKIMDSLLLKNYIKEFLTSHNMLVLATCSNNQPRATPMDYYSDGVVLYVYPGEGKKLINLKENLNVSIGIFSPFTDGDVKGIQITSTKIYFIYRDNPEYERAESIYKWKGKDVYLKIVPEKIEILDFSLQSQGYNSKQVLFNN